MSRVRVIGFGREVADVVSQVLDKELDNVVAQTIGVEDEPVPDSEDELVIFIAEDTKGIEPLLHKFYDAGVLTLLVCSKETNVFDEIFDGKTIVSREKLASTVCDILSPLVHDGRISVDLSDMSLLLKDCRRFYVASGTASGKYRVDNALVPVKDMAERIKGGPQALILTVIHHRNINPVLTMGEVSEVAAYAGELPDSVDVNWAIEYDDSLPVTDVKVISLFV